MASHKKHTKLNELYATALCGNDILSSALYVSGIAVFFAGIYAPLVLLAVAAVLYFYKAVYTEVVEALPINGGAYNGLLNGTSKIVAAIAGVMTTLSYIATAVISAKVAVEYLATIYPIPVIPVTIGLLFAFALLVITGIKDSARVALFIFIVHIITMAVIIAIGTFNLLSNTTILYENIAQTAGIISSHGNLLKTLFFAFSASLLGVSGFESSANFVEEQEPGVFRKTLRNMLIGVAIINPLIALVALGNLHINEIAQAKDFLLADVALALGGPLGQYAVVINAFMVLSGAVLTSYVGVSGLLQRMTVDACLPEWLSQKNKRGSYPRIILLFFLLCSSILILTGGNLLSLAGVYTIAFLGVMSLFAFGNLILKESRGELKRTYEAPIRYVLIALLATLGGIIGNSFIDKQNLVYFSYYFFPAILIVTAVIYEDYLLKFLLRVTKYFPHINQLLNDRFGDLIKGKFVVFIHESNRLYPALEYIRRNETGTNVTIVHCHDAALNDEESKHKTEMETLIKHLQKAGAFRDFTISFMYKKSPFGPDAIKEISKELHVRTNRILVGSIHHTHEFEYQDMGGARIIS